MNRDTDGYEFVHGEESSYGDGSTFGLKIFVRMRTRKVFTDAKRFKFACEEDYTVLYRAARDIKKGLETNSAKLDPEGPATRQSYRNEVERIYRDAGVTTIFVEELPNGYCSDTCCLNRPWFRVTSSIGHVVIGWRKRVMSIDWSTTTVKKSGEELFPEEKVTKLDHGIHAWGADVAVEYLKKLHAEGA